jgi:hypothetical protein
LDYFVVFGEDHLRHILADFVAHYNGDRPHQGKGNRPLTGPDPPDWCGAVAPENVLCDERLGGLLKHYRRRAG